MKKKIKLAMDRKEAEDLIIALGHYLIESTKEELKDESAPYSFLSERYRTLRMLYARLAREIKLAYGLYYLHDEIHNLRKGLPVSRELIDDLTSEKPKHHIAKYLPISVEIARFIHKARQSRDHNIRSFYSKSFLLK